MRTMSRTRTSDAIGKKFQNLVTNSDLVSVNCSCTLKKTCKSNVCNVRFSSIIPERQTYHLRQINACTGNTMKEK